MCGPMFSPTEINSPMEITNDLIKASGPVGPSKLCAFGNDIFTGTIHTFLIFKMKEKVE